jgi:hypothetical protein
VISLRRNDVDDDKAHLIHPILEVIGAARAPASA